MNYSILFLAAILCNAVATVSAQGACQTVTITFNFKPKFPYGNSVDYVCGDLDEIEIQKLIHPKLEEMLKDQGFTEHYMANMKFHDDCPSYDCDEYGDKCIATCCDVKICGITDLSLFTKVAISDEQLDDIKMAQIDQVRSNIPRCLGIKNQFMMDIHATMRIGA